MRNLTLFALINLALKYFWILIISAVVLASGAFAYCEFLATPQYSATGSVLVTNGAILSSDATNSNYQPGSTVNNSDIAASINLADTVTDILNTNGIFKKLSSKLDNRYSYKDLASMAKVVRKSNSSLFINVTFSSKNKEESILLVNEFLEIAPSYINEFVPSTSAISTSIADSATKIFPKTFMTTLAGAALGAALAYAIIVTIHSLNTSIKGVDDFKSRFDIDVLASIPDFSAAKSEKYYKHHPYYAYYGRGVETNENKN